MRPLGAESTLSLAVVLALLAQASAAQPSSAPILPVPAPFTAPSPTGPRLIDDPDTPLGGMVPQGSYEAGVRGAVARAQSLQGPLDGGWVVRDAGGRPLFRFQIVDRGFAGPALEGAWADQRAAGPDASGFFTGMQRQGATVTLTLARAGAGLVTLTLTQRGDGTWTGEMATVLVGRPEERDSVTMGRS